MVLIPGWPGVGQPNSEWPALNPTSMCPHLYLHEPRLPLGGNYRGLNPGRVEYFFIHALKVNAQFGAEGSWMW